MNASNDIVRRIVTTSSMPRSVGPRVSQWANGQQPYAHLGVHLQVRKNGEQIRLEAVETETGALVADVDNIVTMRRVMDVRLLKAA